jgi:RNA polymerase sigma factor (TIGR02999 family)
MTEITRILSAMDEGDPHAADQLLPLVYDELRKLAAHKLAHERPDHTLQATALVHEAYIRLVDVEASRHWDGRRHFFAAAAEAMRRILIEDARRRKQVKRGGGRQRVELKEGDLIDKDSSEALFAINDALDKLAQEDPEAAQLVKLRYFAGLSLEDAADMIGIPRSTAYEHWAYARARLSLELQSGQE